jgi:hypothetical protein
MPGYGLVPADGGSGLLPWSWAVEHLIHSRDYWISTVRPDGRPHVMPVWGIWMDDSLWFSSSRGSRKTKNIASNPAVAVTTDDPLEPVVVEGKASAVLNTEPGEPITRFTGAVNTKYSAEISVEFFLENACFRVIPEKVIGMTEKEFTSSPTRWIFE